MGLKLEDLGAPLIAKISIEDEMNLIHTTNPIDENKSFEELVNYFKNQYKNDIKIFTEIGKKCKACEFHTEPTETEKSGFHECWGEQLRITNSRINHPKVYDVSNFRKSDKLIAEGKYFMDEILENDIDITPAAGKISPTERQWI